LFEAVVGNQALLAPTVGTFVPSVAPGAVIESGDLVGRLRRLGRWFDVVVPAGTAGVVAEVIRGYTAVDYGALLLRLGDVPKDASVAPSSPADADGDGVAVRADVEGTLYLRPKPSEPLFAPEGAAVQQGDTLALVEVMKTFTPVRAPVDGVVGVWAVADSQSVEPGTLLVRVRSG